MGFLTVSVITAQTFQAMTIREKGVPLSQSYLGTSTLARYENSEVTKIYL